MDVARGQFKLYGNLAETPGLHNHSPLLIVLFNFSLASQPGDSN